MEARLITKVGEGAYNSVGLFETCIAPLRNAPQPERFVFERLNKMTEVPRHRQSCCYASPVTESRACPSRASSPPGAHG